MCKIIFLTNKKYVKQKYLKCGGVRGSEFEEGPKHSRFIPREIK